jgi:hypothetical protein
MITSDRFPLANADEKQEPAKQLMRFCMHLETSALSTNRLGINRLELSLNFGDGLAGQAAAVMG